MTASGLLAKARACSFNEELPSIPLDQYEFIEGAVAYDAVDTVSDNEPVAVAKLKLEAEESLDSKSSSK